MGDADFGCDVFGVAARAVGEDQAAAGQFCNRSREFGQFRQHGQVDVVDIVQKRFRFHFVDLHQTGERCAELAVVGFLQVPGVGIGHPKRL